MNLALWADIICRQFIDQDLDKEMIFDDTDDNDIGEKSVMIFINVNWQN